MKATFLKLFNALKLFNPKYFLIFAAVLFLFFAGYISKYSELIFIAHSYIFALATIIIFIIFAIWFAFSKEKINKYTFSPFVLAFLFSFVLLIPFSIVKYDSLVETYRMVSPLLLFWVIINTVQDDKNTSEMSVEQKIYLYAFVGFGLFIGVASYLTFDKVQPLFSIWGYTNTFAAFLTLMILTSMGIYLEMLNKESNDIHDKKIKMLTAIIPMFFIFLIFLTVSRGGYLSLIVAFIVFFSFVRRNLKTIFKQILVIFIGSIILIILYAPKDIILANFGKTEILAKFATGVSYDFSLGDRINMALTAVKIFLKRPLTGFGLGSFKYTYGINKLTVGPYRIDPHSLFFKLLSEVGIIGTLTFFLMVGFILFQAFKDIKLKDKGFIYKGLFAGTVGMLFHMCIDVDIYPIMFVVLFYALALLVPREYASAKPIHKRFFIVFTIVLMLIIPFDLFPKTVASTYAIKGEHPNSLKAVSKSIELLKNASRLDPKSYYYQLYLGDFIVKSMKSYEETDKIEGMIKAYENAFSLNKYDFRAPFKLGMIYLSMKDKRAIDYLKIAEALFPTEPNILAWLSVAYSYILKDTNSADFYIAKAEKYAFEEIDLNFEKGINELRKGNKLLANEYFSKLPFFSAISENSTGFKNYSKGVYNLQIKIIKDIISENQH